MGRLKFLKGWYTSLQFQKISTSPQNKSKCWNFKYVPGIWLNFITFETSVWLFQIIDCPKIMENFLSFWSELHRNLFLYLIRMFSPLRLIQTLEAPSLPLNQDCLKSKNKILGFLYFKSDWISLVCLFF